MGDALLLLGESETDPVADALLAARPRRAAWAVAGVLGLALAVTGTLLWRASRPLERPMMRFSADLGPDAVVGPA